MNKDVELGKEIAKANKESGKWMMPYRDFVGQWEHRIDWDRFDWEGGETELHEALLLAVHGFGLAGGTMSFLSIPEHSEE